MFAGILFSLAVLAVLIGLADRAASGPTAMLQRWQQAGRMIAPAEWVRARERLQLAIRLDSGEPRYRFNIGRLYYWQALKFPLDSGYAKRYLDAALRRARQAVARRPSWGFGWVTLAEMAFLSGRFAAEAPRWLEHGIALSAQEPGTQYKAIWLGMRYWARLSLTGRDLIRGAVRDALTMHNREYEIMGLAVAFGWQDELGRLVTSAPHRAWLKRMTAPR